MVHETDAALGLLVRKLKELDLYDDTLVVYTSDNGAARYRGHAHWDAQEYFSFAGGFFGGNRVDREVEEEGRGGVLNPQGVSRDGEPLKGHKGDVYEGGHRVPLVIAGGRRALPASFPAGTESEQLIGLHDLYATICDLLGIDVPAGQARDSVSFRGVLDGSRPESRPLRSHLLAQGRVPVEYEQAEVQRIAAIRGLEPQRNEQGWIVGLAGGGSPTPSQINGWLEGGRVGRAIYHQKDGRRWKLIFTTNDRRPRRDVEAWALHELVADPDESENLIGRPEQAERVARLLGKYREIVE